MPSSYVGASQLHADISKTKHLITESCLSRRAKEACIPVFNNFAAIAAFLMEEPRLVEGAHEGLNVGLRLSHSSRSNRIAPTKSAQPIAYGTYTVVCPWVLAIMFHLQCCILCPVFIMDGEQK